jgi:hypothetical protein
MNTLQINKVLTKHVKYFKGVYPIDLLLQALTKPTIIVVNLDEHYMPGSHWVALCFGNSGYAEYFDSYGIPPIKLEIVAYLQRHSISWAYNRNRLQGFTSDVCGQYCCLYCHHRSLGFSMTSFTNQFKPARFSCNDIKAVTLFRVQFGKYLACRRINTKHLQSCTSQL